MSKKKIVKTAFGEFITNSHELRKQIEFYYLEKFYNKFVNKFDFNDTISYQQKDYLMRKLWGDGTISAFHPTVMSEKDKYFNLVFAPWVVGGLFNCYDYPIKAHPVNLRAVSYIPNKDLEVDKEIVLGWIQRNKKSIYLSIKPMLEKLVNVEMTIRTNLKAQKTPWLIGVSPENENKMKILYDNLDSDDPKLFVSIEDIQNLKALNGGATYNIDKLEMQRQQVENEILTRIGIQNIGVMEKKEHFTVGEVDANNQQITSSCDEYLTCLEEFCQRIRDTLDYEITVSLKEEISYNDNINEGGNNDE